MSDNQDKSKGNENEKGKEDGTGTQDIPKCPNNSNKSKNHSRKNNKSRDSSSRKYGKGKPTNDPAWYNSNLMPYVGANFASILSADPSTNKVLSSRGAQLMCHQVYKAVVLPPVDPFCTAENAIRTLYAEMRAVNAGASNFAPNDLFCYHYNLTTARVLYKFVARAIGTLEMSSPLYGESPYVFAALSLIDNYDAEVANLANLKNRMAIIGNALESLPVLPETHLNFMEDHFATLFSDTSSHRRTLIAIHPTRFFYYAVDSVNNSQSTITATGYNLINISSLSAVVDTLYSIVQKVLAIPVNNIIRGDMLKTFGSKALRPNLVTNLFKAPTIDDTYLTRMKFKNATVLGVKTENVTYYPGIVAGDGDVWEPPVVKVTAINEHSDSLLEMDQFILTYDGDTVPTPPELLEITRFHASGDSADNSTSGVVKSCSGILLADIAYIRKVFPDVGPSRWYLSTFLRDIYSTVQSTALAAHKHLEWVFGIIDDHPMIVTDRDDPCGYLLDVNNYAIIDKEQMANYTAVANRMLSDVHIGRRDDGRLER